jgi:hypothetical protein
VLKLSEIYVRPVMRQEEAHFQELMRSHHYLGAMPKISETLWYVALFRGQWAALLSFSAAALKCAPRDRWIGWDCRHQYARLKLVTNNGRYPVPSLSVLRDLLIRVDPAQLDQALQKWNQVYGVQDASLAIDGKTMCNALDPQGEQTHIMSVVGHQSKTCYTQKK